MNRFRKTKKEKAKEDVEVPESTSTSFGSIFQKNKKEPEQKPDFDLTTALPPSDDFRTSLLMPKLSARFSMLREQDDPNSLLGKANDDSVLFPKRASRLNLFGHNPNMLSDIDEGSDGRPSFSLGRTPSYVSGDGYGTDDDRSQQDSIMSRARRAEGNNLFGGRQKVYKIPSKSPSSASNPESTGRGLGRAVYENDINTMSVFQRQKLREKEAKEAEERAAAAAEESQHSTPIQESEDAFSSVSSTKRTTYSSTASGPTTNARISTAATSVDEQPLATPSSQTVTAAPDSKPAVPGMAPERGSVKTRRLYGQGLAQSVQHQQASTLHRLESLSRQRGGGPDIPPLNRAYSRSATNLRDRLQRLAITEPSPVPSRPTSPASSATSPKQQHAESDLKTSGAGVPPLSPPASENEDGATLMAALQPEDRGKATALGLFNKPKTTYDENQFSRRQLQMFQGRNTPPPQQPLPPLRQRSPPPGRFTPQDSGVRPRGLSNTSYLSRPGSSASSHYSEPRGPGSRSTAASINASPARPAHIGTFFDNSSPSETEDEGYGIDPRGTRFSTEAEHPALRSATPSKPSTPTDEQQDQSPLPEIRYSDLHDLKPIAEHDLNESSPPRESIIIPEKPDSPTLGPAGLGLSGLVRAHLRSNSDRSDIYPLPSPLHRRPMKDEMTCEPSIDPQPVSNPVSRPPPLVTTKNPVNPAWRDELMSGHRRQESTETQKEREEFEIELAERRRRVQEKLRDFAESESRAASPVSGRQTPDLGQPRPGNAFALLKNKSTKHNLFTRQEPKGIKGFRYENASTPALVSDDPWRDEDERMPPHFGRHPNSSSPHIADKSIRPKMGVFNRSSQEESRESSRSRGASPHSSLQSRRDRSGSDASGRSKSRTRRERDDLGTLREDTIGYPRRNAHPDHDQRGMSSVASSARPSVETSDRPAFDRNPSTTSGRFRYEASAWPPSSGYHDRPVHTPPATNTPPLVGATAPRPSPAAPPYSANATPPLHEPSTNSIPPSPATYPSHAQPLPQRAPGHNSLAKRFIDKNLISEPKFVSSTSNVPTVGLPPGASLHNGMETPPLPPMNPRRRRQTTTQTILGALKGDKHEPHSDMFDSEPNGEYSTFSDGGDKKPRQRQRLRKASSEGGDLNAKARQQILSGPIPAVPAYPPTKVPMDGGMF